MKDNPVYEFYPNPSVTDQLVGLSVGTVERDLIVATLRQTNGNRTHAAEVLGISIRTLRNKLHEYEQAGIAVPQARRLYSVRLVAPDAEVHPATKNAIAETQ